MLKKLKTIAKNVLAIPVVRKAYVFINRSSLSFAASNRLFASIYSIFGLFTFNREQYAVLRARRNYYRNLGNIHTNHAGLRRNIHRLEKGMIMKPAKPVFATDYIGETIEFYKSVINKCVEDNKIVDMTEIEWAHDVLEKYFNIVATGNSKVENARLKFMHCESIFSPKSKVKKVPYDKDSITKSKVTYKDMLALSYQRRSIRWFKKKKVPRQLIDKALMVARQAPTACNRLPYEFRIYDNPQMVKKISNIPFGTAGYSHQIPTIVVVIGKLENYFSPRDRHAIYIDSSLAAMSFIFGLETLGLSSSVINWPDFEPLEQKMQKTLGLDVSERVVMLIAIGYADPKGGVPFSQKKALDTLRSYNKVADS